MRRTAPPGFRGGHVGGVTRIRPSALQFRVRLPNGRFGTERESRSLRPGNGYGAGNGRRAAPVEKVCFGALRLRRNGMDRRGGERLNRPREGPGAWRVRGSRETFPSVATGWENELPETAVRGKRGASRGDNWNHYSSLTRRFPWWKAARYSDRLLPERGRGRSLSFSIAC